MPNWKPSQNVFLLLKCEKDGMFLYSVMIPHLGLKTKNIYEKTLERCKLESRNQWVEKQWEKKEKE